MIAIEQYYWMIRNWLLIIGKGGKQRKKAKNIQVGERRELVFKEEGQEYG